MTALAQVVAALSGAGIDCAVIGAMALAARGVIERAEPLDFAGTQVRVATAADLVLLKLYAGGPSDLWDIEQLLGGDDERSLVAEIETRLAELPATCSALWRRLRDR